MVDATDSKSVSFGSVGSTPTASIFSKPIDMASMENCRSDVPADMFQVAELVRVWLEHPLTPQS